MVEAAPLFHVPLFDVQLFQPASPSASEPQYPFHVLYRRAYDRTVSGICTEFCEEVLVDSQNKNNDIFDPKIFTRNRNSPLLSRRRTSFYPKRDVSKMTFTHNDDTFNYVLNNCQKSLILLSNDNIECENFDKFLEQSLSAKNKVPVLSVRLGEHNEDLYPDVQHLQTALNPIEISKVKENWSKEKYEINCFLKTNFVVSSIDIPRNQEKARFVLSEDVKFTSASDLLNIHNDRVNKFKEEFALARWMKTYNLGDNVRKMFNDCGISTRKNILQVYKNLDEWRSKRGLNLNMIDLFDFQRGAQDIESRTFIWREGMDSHVLKSMLWHLVTTIRLRQKCQQQSEDNFAITDSSVFIEALSRELCHPENCLHLIKQGAGSITFVAKCIDFDDLKSLRRRIIEKASNFQEPFCVCENTELYCEKSEFCDRPAIVSKMIDFSEEHDIKLFNSGCIEQETQVPLNAIEALPDEILVKIFQMLPFLTKISVLPKVCEKWSRIAKDVIVLDTFDLREIPARHLCLTLQFIIHLINANKYLRPRKLILPRLERKDEMQEEEKDENAVFNLLKTGSKLGLWKSLTKLSAQNMEINEDVFSKFVSSLNSEIFTELSVHKLTQNKMNSICRHLTKLQRFTALNMYMVNAVSLRRLNVSKDMKYLRELRVYVHDDSPERFLSNLLQSNQVQLELLTISMYRDRRSGNDAHFWDFLKSLGLCQKLTYLDLKLPEVVLYYDELCRTLASMTRLEQLHLSINHMTFAGRRTYSIFRELNNLRHVCLSIDLEDEDVTDLCISSGHCLETISLFEGNALTDNALTSIITYCNKLLVLKLSHFTNIDCVKLLENLTENPEKHLPRLVLLNLILHGRDEIPGDVLANCLTARPKLFIKTGLNDKHIKENNYSIDRCITKKNSLNEIAVSSVLYRILGPKCHRRKSLIRELLHHSIFSENNMWVSW